jgi:hypothetical protein
MVDPMAKGPSRRSRRRLVSDVGDEPTLMRTSTGTTQRSVVAPCADAPRAAGGRSCHVDPDPPKGCRLDDVDGRLAHLAAEILACAVALACQLDDIQGPGGSPVTLATPARVSARAVPDGVSAVEGNPLLMAPSTTRDARLSALAWNGRRSRAQPCDVT